MVAFVDMLPVLLLAYIDITWAAQMRQIAIIDFDYMKYDMEYDDEL